MPEDHTFNGWTNYETWAVNHWLAIEEADQEWLMALSLDPNIASLHDKAEVLKPTFPIWLKSFLSNSSMVFQPLSNYGPFCVFPAIITP